MFAVPIVLTVFICAAMAWLMIAPCTDGSALGRSIDAAFRGGAAVALLGVLIVIWVTTLVAWLCS